MNIERQRRKARAAHRLLLSWGWIAILAILAACGGGSDEVISSKNLPDVTGRWEVTDDMNKNAFALAQEDGIVLVTRSRQLGEFQGVVTANGVEAPAK